MQRLEGERRLGHKYLHILCDARFCLAVIPGKFKALQECGGAYGLGGNRHYP